MKDNGCCSRVKYNPLGEGSSVGKFLAQAIKELEKLNVKYQITPMCTIFEAKNVGEAFKIAEVVHEFLFKMGVKHVVTKVKVDDRRDINRIE